MGISTGEKSGDSIVLLIFFELVLLILLLSVHELLLGRECSFLNHLRRSTNSVSFPCVEENKGEELLGGGRGLGLSGPKGDS